MCVGFERVVVFSCFSTSNWNVSEICEGRLVATDSNGKDGFQSDNQADTVFFLELLFLLVVFAVLQFLRLFPSVLHRVLLAIASVAPP